MIAAALLLMSSAACAHAHLKASVPQEGARLTQAPAVIVLSFSEAAQLSTVTLEGPDAVPVRLTPPATPQAEIRVSLPPLAPGSYRLRWRVIGVDGHVLPGELHFRIGS